MNAKVRVDGHKKTLDMQFMTSQAGRAGKLDDLKWLWCCCSLLSSTSARLSGRLCLALANAALILLTLLTLL